MSIHIRKSFANDVDALTPRLRKLDIEEIMAFSGRDPKTALQRGFQNSKECWSGYSNDQIIGMFGVGEAPDAASVGVPWMLASDGIYEHKRLFIRESKLWVHRLIKDYDALVNYVLASNTHAIRWLKWLGFDLVKLFEGLGTNGQDFWKFVMVKDDKDA